MCFSLFQYAKPDSGIGFPGALELVSQVCKIYHSLITLLIHGVTNIGRVGI